MNAQIWRFDNANALYYALVDALALSIGKIIESGRSPVIALPTGNTMIPFYRIATENEEKLQISKWQCFNLDEYFPITEETHPLSFDHYMDVHFYSRLKNGVKSREILRGDCKDPDRECARYEEKLANLGGIDIALLGLGTNAHIAFNEPGSEFDSRTRAVELHPQTLFANFKGKAPFTHALTLGIGTLLSAKEIYVVAHGKNKAQAVKEAIESVPSRTLPASALQAHAQVTWFLDQEASSFI